MFLTNEDYINRTIELLKTGERACLAGSDTRERETVSGYVELVYDKEREKFLFEDYTEHNGEGFSRKEEWTEHESRQKLTQNALGHTAKIIYEAAAARKIWEIMNLLKEGKYYHEGGMDARDHEWTEGWQSLSYKNEKFIFEDAMSHNGTEQYHHMKEMDELECRDYLLNEEIGERVEQIYRKLTS